MLYKQKTQLKEWSLQHQAQGQAKHSCHFLAPPNHLKSCVAHVETVQPVE